MKSVNKFIRLELTIQKLILLILGINRQFYGREPAIAAMHGPQSVFDIGHCTVIHCDAGGVLLVDQ